MGKKPIFETGKRKFNQLIQRLNRPVFAIPVDMFRILVGCLSFAYFLRTYFQIGEFSSPNGLIDHQLLQNIFWFTRLSLFQPGLGDGFFRGIYLAAGAASLALAAGYQSRLMAGFMFVVAVSIYRWNFLVTHVEDGIMHLVLLWVFLLPVGRTLVLGEWLHEGKKALKRWKQIVVPGAAVRMFLANMGLAYVTAGLWKWTSPMWRDGTALFTILQLGVSRFPNFFTIGQLPLLKAANYFSLIIEPLLTLIIVLPKRHILKFVLLGCMTAFHLGIVVTMDLPFANLAMLAAAILIFRDEIMDVVNRGTEKTIVSKASLKLQWQGGVAVLLVALLTMQMITDIRVPHWRAPARETGSTVVIIEDLAQDATRLNPFYVPLWVGGVVQSYRLFDWIDDRNFVVSYEVFAEEANEAVKIEPTDLFPNSVRNTLLQSYVHGITWMKVPQTQISGLKTSILTRYAQRYCERFQPTGSIDVYATVQEVMGQAGEAGEPAHLIEFECVNLQPIFLFMQP